MVTNINTVLVCLPVYNEERAIKSMINQIRGEGFEVVVTDGGSKDRSIEIAQELGVEILHRPGKGKGFGMKMALEYAHQNKKEIIVFIDCDLTYPIDKIKSLVAFTSEADLVIGARERSKMSLRSKILNTLLIYITKIIYRRNIYDSASGFRAIKVEKFINKLHSKGMDLELEMTGFACKMNYSIKEIDVNYCKRVGESKLNFSHILFAGFTIFKTRLKSYK